MKIAQLAPLHASLTKRDCHDIDRVVTDLTGQLVARGHDVTLFDTNDMTETDKCSGTLPSSDAVELLMDGNFDVIHAHDVSVSPQFLRDLPMPTILTLYRYPTATDIRRLAGIPLIAVSEDQRASWRRADWRATIPCGLNRPLSDFNSKAARYLAYTGSLTASGGVTRAIEVAALSGLPLRALAAVSREERRYLTETIRPLSESRGIQFEIVERDACNRQALLSGALALLFPGDWPAPCPLALLESLACGTPVIAWRNPGVAEIICDEATGFLVQSIDGAMRAVSRLGEISRLTCRRSFDKSFTAQSMAQKCLHLYGELRHDHAVARVVSTSQWFADRELSRRF